MTRAIHHALASAAQFAEKFVVAENRWRRGLFYGTDSCPGLGWGLHAGRIGIEFNGGIEQAVEAEVIRRVARNGCSATVASAGGAHGIYGVRAHSTGYYRNER